MILSFLGVEPSGVIVPNTMFPFVNGIDSTSSDKASYIVDASTSKVPSISEEPLNVPTIWSINPCASPNIFATSLPGGKSCVNANCNGLHKSYVLTTSSVLFTLYNDGF